MPSTSRRVGLTLIQLFLAILGTIGAVIYLELVLNPIFLMIPIFFLVCASLAEIIVRGALVVFIFILPIIFTIGFLKITKLRRVGDYSNTTVLLGLKFLVVPTAIIIFLILISALATITFPYIGSCGNL